MFVIEHRTLFSTKHLISKLNKLLLIYPRYIVYLTFFIVYLAHLIYRISIYEQFGALTVNIYLKKNHIVRFMIDRF